LHASAAEGAIAPGRRSRDPILAEASQSSRRMPVQKARASLHFYASSHVNCRCRKRREQGRNGYAPFSIAIPRRELRTHSAATISFLNAFGTTKCKPCDCLVTFGGFFFARMHWITTGQKISTTKVAVFFPKRRTILKFDCFMKKVRTWYSRFFDRSQINAFFRKKFLQK